MSEIYISIDIESDGPCPGINSMLSLGAAAFILDKDYDGSLVGTWTKNFKTLPGASPDERTKKEFWDKNPKAWEACRKNLVSPDYAMNNFKDWLKGLEKQYKGKVVGVGAPAGFDFTFVYWYFMKFVGHSPLSFSCIDMKTYAMCVLNKPYKKSGKRAYPKHWFKEIEKRGLTHSHISVEDATEQGYLFCAMMRESLNKL